MSSEQSGAPASAEHPVADGPRPDSGPDGAIIAVGVAIVLAIVVWAGWGTSHFSTVSESALDWVLANFGWLFIVAGDAFLGVCVAIALSRFGRVRLGADEDEPEFNNFAWIAMMFSAGMGIGLMFFGVGEPLMHHASPPPFEDVDPETAQSASDGIRYSLFHWTLHPWAIYGVAGLGLAYVTFRKGRGNQLSSVFVPLLGRRRAERWPGKLIDLLAVFATVFGTATSLGLGALQVAKGLNLTAGWEDSQALELILIAALGSAFVASAFSGLHRGIKWLSSMNVWLAAALMVFVFLVGPSVYVLDAIPASVGSYLHQLLPMSTRTNAFGDQEWLGTWTIFYWAWWLSWAPFVGTFIARISQGRTIREFLVGVLLVPSGASVLWFCVLGGSALRLDQTGAADLTGEVNDGGEEAALFGLLDALPLAGVTAVVAMVLVMAYFVTSADSASLVMGSLTSRGALNPRRWLVVTWGVLMAAVAAVLLAAGGLTALRSGTILVALPFTLVMLAMCWSLVKELRADPGAGPPRHQALLGMREAARRMIGEAISEERGVPRRHQWLHRTVVSRRQREREAREGPASGESGAAGESGVPGEPGAAGEGSAGGAGGTGGADEQR